MSDAEFNRAFFEDCLRDNSARKITFAASDSYGNKTVYTAYVGTHYTEAMCGFLGFCGRHFKFLMPDGSILRSNNVWCRGDWQDVPDDLKPRFISAQILQPDF